MRFRIASMGSSFTYLARSWKKSLVASPALALAAMSAAPLVTAGCGGSSDIDIGAGSMATSSASGSGSGSASGGTGGSGGGSSSGTASTGNGGGAPIGECEGLSGDTGDFEKTLMSDGQAREYKVHVPAGYSPSKPTMLVLDFHGYLEQNDDIEKVSKMDGVSDAHNFIAVYPQGLSTSWNAGSCCGSSASGGVKDVEFVSAMLDALEKEYCVDKKRVFSVGFSNGGMLSHRLACELSDRIAAIGPVAGTLAIDNCAPTRPVPVIHFHGTGDFVVPYDGGGAGGAESVKDTISGWAQRNGCTGDPVNVYNKGDASCDEYQNCAAGSAVRVCTIDNGGHQWPGGESAGPLGNVSTDISASEEMFTFFSAHPMQ